MSSAVAYCLVSPTTTQRHSTIPPNPPPPTHPSPLIQATLSQSSIDTKWYVNFVARHTSNPTCRTAVYWGRVSLPPDGELVGRAAVQASDYLWSSEVALAYPSVAVSPAGVVWVGYVFWGATQPPGEEASLLCRAAALPF